MTPRVSHKPSQSHFNDAKLTVPPGVPDRNRVYKLHAGAVYSGSRIRDNGLHGNSGAAYGS